MSFTATTESAIFERIVLANRPGVDIDTARTILALQFSPDDRERMQTFAEKAKSGTLTPEEEEAADNYERVGHYLAILQSKARIALRTAEPSHS